MAVMDSYQISTEPVRSERIDKLHKYITSSKYGVCVERGKLITEYYRNHPDEANIVKRANAIDYVLQNMSIYIMPGSLFAGKSFLSFQEQGLWLKYHLQRPVHNMAA